MKKSKIKNVSNEIDKKRLKRIIMVIIFVIIILLLLTSCVSGFWGKIGNGFGSSSDYEISDNQKEMETIYDEELKFITEEGETYKDETYRIEYIIDTISPEEFTCTTSDANLATCLVNDNYIEAYAKNSGDVGIYVQAITNDKKYIGRHKLTILDQKRGVFLEENTGEINLKYNKTLKIPYEVENIDGNILVELTDDKIASAKVENGLLIITGKKVGETTVTISIRETDAVFKDSIDLQISNNVIKKSSENKLSNITISKGTFDAPFDTHDTTYIVDVEDEVDKITLTAEKVEEKETLYYYVNNAKVDSLEDIELKYGKNVITITVKAEDSSTNKYTITINRKKKEIIPEPTPEPSPEPAKEEDKKEEEQKPVQETEKPANSNEENKEPEKQPSNENNNSNNNNNNQKPEENKPVEETKPNQPNTPQNPTENKPTEEKPSTPTVPSNPSNNTNNNTSNNSNNNSNNTNNSNNNSSNNNSNTNNTTTTKPSNSTKPTQTSKPSSTTTKPTQTTTKPKPPVTIGPLKPINPGDPVVPPAVEPEEEIPVIENNYSTINTLDKLITNQGEINPSFNPDILYYYIDVKNTDTINIIASLTDSKSTMHYRFNSKIVNDLTNLKLNLGYNFLKIMVTAEDGSIRIYSLIITRLETETNPRLSSINTLTSLKVNKGTLSPKYNKDLLQYFVSIDIKDNFTIKEKLTDDKSTIKYYVNGTKIDSLENIPLNNGLNIVELVITAENGNIRTYTVKVQVKDPLSDINTLKDILLSNGNLNPTYDRYNNDYTVDLPYNIDNITINPIKDIDIETIKYYINDKEVNNLNNIELYDSTTYVKIVVTSESGIPNTYTLTLNKHQITDNTLKAILINNYYLDNFEPTVNDYDIVVKHNTNKISIKGIPKSNLASVEYYLNDNKISDIDNIELNNENNQIKIVVTNNIGNKNTYIVNITKRKRTIDIKKNTQVIKLKDISKNIAFDLYEENIATNDYLISDINVSFDQEFKGSYKVHKGYITITPSIEDANKDYKLTLNYGDSTDTITLKIKAEDIYIKTPVDEYTINYVEDSGERNIIFNTNLFDGEIISRPIPNGVRLSNKIGYIDIITNDPSIITINYDEDSNTSYISFKANAHQIGTTKVTLTGQAYGKQIPGKEITIHVIGKYKVVIDANGGFYTDNTAKYEYVINHNEQIDLSKYIPYKEDKSGSCLYYELDSYNDSKDGKGTKYNKNDKITITKDLTLYAIYTSTSKYIELPESNIMYLTEVDLFHNEAYYQKYNIDKIIYPGANGYHIMTIKNTTNKPLKIKKINLEEDTTCVSEDGCVNMGYIIKHAKSKDKNWTYYYGSESDYQILYKDENTTKTHKNNNNYHTKNTIDFSNNYIEIAPNETIEISLLWKWLDLDDILDTKIGSLEHRDKYELTVSIEYDTTKEYCQIK